MGGSAEPAGAAATAEVAKPPRSGPLFRVLQALAGAGILVLLALLVWRIVAVNRGADLVKAISAGERPSAPAFSLPLIWTPSSSWSPALRGLLAQRELALEGLRSRPLVLNFWASWCIPCKEEAPQLNAAARAHAGSVVFLGIDVQDLAPDARRFLGREHVLYPSVRDGSGSVYDRYGLTGVPETYWLDARGRIVDHYSGALSRRQLEAGIRAAMTGR